MFKCYQLTEAVPPRSIHLSLQQHHIIKENVRDMHIEQTLAPAGIRIGGKLPAGIALHHFSPVAIEKVPQVKTYKFFMTQNQIVLASPQKQIAAIIDFIKRANPRLHRRYACQAQLQTRA